MQKKNFGRPLNAAELTAAVGGAIGGNVVKQMQIAGKGDALPTSTWRKMRPGETKIWFFNTKSSFLDDESGNIG